MHGDLIMAGTTHGMILGIILPGTAHAGVGVGDGTGDGAVFMPDGIALGIILPGMARPGDGVDIGEADTGEATATIIIPITTIPAITETDVHPIEEEEVLPTPAVHPDDQAVADVLHPYVIAPVLQEDRHLQ